MSESVGTIVKLSDGRVGTVIYNGLDGVGIKWGKIMLSESDIELIYRGDGNFTKGSGCVSEDYQFFPDAMLRDPYPSAIREGIDCVGEDYVREKPSSCIPSAPDEGGEEKGNG